MDIYGISDIYGIAFDLKRLRLRLLRRHFLLLLSALINQRELHASELREEVVLECRPHVAAVEIAQGCLTFAPGLGPDDLEGLRLMLQVGIRNHLRKPAPIFHEIDFLNHM